VLLRQKKGARYTGIVGSIILAIGLILFCLTWDLVSAIIMLTITGFGLGGSFYFYLIGVYPAIVLVIGLIGLYFYPIKGKRYFLFRQSV
jgi:hypothetical protein